MATYERRVAKVTDIIHDVGMAAFSKALKQVSDGHNGQHFGGLDEQDLTIAFNDVDFCLRVHARGFRNIFAPRAELYHHESISRGSEDSPEKQQRFRKEIDYMLRQYDIQNIEELPNDLFYNPNLTKIHENFEINTSLKSVSDALDLRSNYVAFKSYYQRQ